MYLQTALVIKVFYYEVYVNMCYKVIIWQHKRNNIVIKLIFFKLFAYYYLPRLVAPFFVTD